MQTGIRQFFRDAGPAILLLDRRHPGLRMSAPQFLRLAAGLLGLGLLVFGLVWSRGAVNTSAYEIRALRNEYDRVEAEHRRLQAEWDEMHSLAGVEAIAEQRLRMVKVNPNQVINLPPPAGLGDRLESGWDSLLGRLGLGSSSGRP